MNNNIDEFQKKILSLIDRDSKLLHRDLSTNNLLKLEKERRGVPTEELVFVGTNDVADSCWCQMRAVLHSRRNESMYFYAYLFDRLLYAYKLGLIKNLPRHKKEILRIGDELVLEQILQFLPKSNISANHNPRNEIEIKQYLANLDWRKRGYESQRLLAERYATIRWNFDFDKYTVLGVPDGIGNDFVYEFKTTSKNRFIENIKLKGFWQTDIYGFFFKKHKKRVQVHAMQESITHTWEEPVDAQNARQVLTDFLIVDHGNLPSLPEPFKCRDCDVSFECPLKPPLRDLD